MISALDFRLRWALVVMLGGAISVVWAQGFKPSDLRRFDLLIAESEALLANEPERALALARSAIEMADQADDLSGQLRARARWGDALKFNTRYDEAVEVITAGLALPHSDATRPERAWLRYELGRVHWNMSRYAEAEKCFVEVQREAEAVGDQILLARVSNSRGIVASNQWQPEVAKAQYQIALELAESLEDDVLQAKVLNNMALIYRNEGDADHARELFAANLALHQAREDQRGMANALINLATVEETVGRYEQAVEYNRRALALRLEIGVTRHVASAYISLGVNLARLGQGEPALETLALAAPLASEVDSEELTGNLYAALSAAYAVTGDFKSAWDAQRIAETAKNRVAGENTARTVAELRERFEAEKKQREISERQAAQREQQAELALNAVDLKRTQQQRFGLLAILSLGALAVGAVISRQRTQARAERRILEETQRAKGVAETANALKSRLIDLVSHDLKNPLVGMMMMADLLGAEGVSQELVAERSRAMKQESEQMFGLVQDILDSSAAESGQLALDVQPLDLGQVVRSSLSAWQDRAANKRQKVRFAIEHEEACKVEADQGRIRQVLDNLVGNAVKFSPLGSEIVVRVEGGATVRFSVIDQGPGFTTEDLARVFKPYQKLSAFPTGGESSSGLGLSLAKSLVELHGGSLQVVSSGRRGATLVAAFPELG